MADQSLRSAGLPALALLALAPLALAMSIPTGVAAQTVIAHRGASAYLPEHTMIAWERAIALGADYIEQDLQMTSDGVLVVLHDATLERTARGPEVDCTGRVNQKTLAQLKRCEVSSWKVEQLRARGDVEAAERLAALPLQRIPTLDEVLLRFGTDGSVRYYIETKQPEEAPGMELALLALLQEHGLGPESPDDRTVLIQSFSPASLQMMHELDPRLSLVQLIGGGDALAAGVESAMARIADYAVGVGPSSRLVTAEFVAAAHSQGLVIHPYTVNEPARMRALLDLGVDGMFTDLPELLIQHREGR